MSDPDHELFKGCHPGETLDTSDATPTEELLDRLIEVSSMLKDLELPDPGHYLVYRTSENAQARFHRIGERCAVGRVAEGGLQIDDPGMSRLHFICTCTEDGVELKDNQSKNGVVVNGRKYCTRHLNSGDLIFAGHTKFAFVEQPG